MINKKIIFYFSWLLISLLILLIVIIISLCIGSSGILLKDIINVLLTKRVGTVEHSIIFDIRVPRIILGFAVGSSLSISGVILQGIFRNPLVEPYTLGISGGAAFAICLNILLGLNKENMLLSIPISGFLGSILVLLIIYLLSTRKGILKINQLLLTGVMISFIASSLIMFIMSISRLEDLHQIIHWTMGSLEEPNLLLIKIIFFISLLGYFVSYFFSVELNTFLLGEEEAIHLGINVNRVKKILFVLASLLTGSAVSVAGIIGFVGLVIPHLVRIIVGNDHRILIICSGIIGAAFLILSDTIARTIIAPVELPVGVITGIIGGSTFIYFLYKRNLYKK